MYELPDLGMSLADRKGFERLNRRLAKWDGSDWSGLGAGIAGGSVFALTAFDDGIGPALYAGGNFTQAGEYVSAFAAKWATIGAPSTPTSPEMMPDSSGVQVESAKNRYLSISAGDPGRSQAIRVAFVSLPPPYNTWNGTEIWVQQPAEVCNLGGLIDPTDPSCGSETYWSATLGCDPFFTDWTAYSVVHVRHAGIVPSAYDSMSGTIVSAWYSVQVIDQSCAMEEVNFSQPLVVRTSRYGNVAGSFVSGQGRDSYTAPDPGHNVDIAPDFLSVIDAFRGTDFAPIKPRVDVEPAVPDQLINITDAVAVVDAFRGLYFPFFTTNDPCP